MLPSFSVKSISYLKCWNLTTQQLCGLLWLYFHWPCRASSRHSGSGIAVKTFKSVDISVVEFARFLVIFLHEPKCRNAIFYFCLIKSLSSTAISCIWFRFWHITSQKPSMSLTCISDKNHVMYHPFQRWKLTVEGLVPNLMQLLLFRRTYLTTTSFDNRLKL